MVSQDGKAQAAVDGATLRYTPVAADANQTVTLTVKATDSGYDSTRSVTVTIAVGAVPPNNHAPQIVGGENSVTVPTKLVPASLDGVTPGVNYTNVEALRWFSDSNGEKLAL